MIDQPVHRRRALVADELPKPTFLQSLLLPGILFFQTLFVGSTYRTWPIALIGFVSTVLMVFIVQQAQSFLFTSDTNSDPPAESSASTEDTRVKAQKRYATVRKVLNFAAWPLALIVGVSVAMFRIGFHFSGNLNPVAMIVDTISHFALFVAFVLWGLFPRHGHPALLPLGLILVLTTVTAGGVSHTINGQTVAALAAVLGYLFAARHILPYWQDRKSRRTRQKTQSKRRARLKGFVIDDTGNVSGNSKAPLPASTVSVAGSPIRTPVLYTVIAASLVLTTTSAAGHLAGRVIPGLQLKFFDSLSQSLEAVATNQLIGGTKYVSGSRLGAIRQHMIGDPGEVALRAYAEASPGYLRGTIFDTYQNSVWKNATERALYEDESDSLRPRQVSVLSEAQTSLMRPTNAPMSRFQVRKNSGERFVGTIEIHNIPLKGSRVFTSLSTDWMEAAGSEIQLSHHDQVLAGIDTSEPYVLGVTEDTPQETMGEIRRSTMLSMPLQVRQIIEPITRGICQGILTPKAKAEAIQKFFQSNFQYTLQDRNASPSGMDPIANFIVTRHPAHCEYFGTATALMLRCVDVPTRYVTGYVVDEKSDEYDYFVARNRDAHAWVEAYDDTTERWFPVESTVGRYYRTLALDDESSEASDQATDRFLDFENEDSILGMIFGRLLSFRASDSLQVVFRFAQLPLFCVAVGLLWLRYRNRIKGQTDEEEQRVRQMLVQMDRKLKRYTMMRSPTETLHQFARRLESEASGEDQAERASFMVKAADWYRHYASARYCGEVPNPMA